MHSTRLLLSLAVPLLVVTACAGSGSSTMDPSQPASREPGATRQPFQTVPPLETSGQVPAGPDGIPGAVWAAVVEDVTRRVGAPIPDPDVIEATAVTWNDGSLGCPVPGQMYTQALVDGYQVIVEVDGEQFDYRIGGSTDIRLCESPLEGG